MSYTANTPAYFDAVIAGALGGMLDGQTTTSTARGVSNESILAAASLAQEIDTQIGVVGSPSVGAANLLIELCYAWYKGRNPNTNPNAASPASYAAIATAIVATWTAAATYLQ